MIDVDLDIRQLRLVIVTGHILLLRIVTELLDVNVLAEKQSIVVLPNTPSLVSPKGTDCSSGNTAEMQPNFVRVKKSADGQSVEHLAFAKVQS